MILSDKDIRKAIADGRVTVSPPESELFEHIHASSMDFRLGNTFKLYEHSKFAALDPMNPESFAGILLRPRRIGLPDVRGEMQLSVPGIERR